MSQSDQPQKRPASRTILYVYLAIGIALLSIIAAVYFLFVVKPDGDIDDNLKPLSVLIVGNDVLHFNDIPNMLREVATMSKSWRPLDVACIAQDDFCLAQHAGDKETLRMIAEKDWDFIVLQERWTQPLQDPAAMLESATVLAKAAREKRSEVVLLIPWADSGEKARQEVLSTVSRKLAERLSLQVAPAGDIFFQISEKHKDLSLYEADKHHVTPLGSWIAAATVFAVVTGQKPRLTKQFTYNSGFGEEPQVSIEADLATDLETNVWETTKRDNDRRALGPPILKPTVSP